MSERGERKPVSEFTLVDAHEAIHLILGHAMSHEATKDLIAQFSELDDDDRLMLFTALAFEANRQTSALLDVLRRQEQE